MSKPHIKSFRGHHCDAQLTTWLKSNHITIAYELPTNKPNISEWIKEALNRK